MGWNGRVEDARKRFGEHHRPSDWNDTKVEVAHDQAQFIEGMGISDKELAILYGLDGAMFGLVVQYLSEHDRANVMVAITMVKKKLMEDEQAAIRQQLNVTNMRGKGQDVQIKSEPAGWDSDREVFFGGGGNVIRGPFKKS